MSEDARAVVVLAILLLAAVVVIAAGYWGLGRPGDSNDRNEEDQA